MRNHILAIQFIYGSFQIESNRGHQIVTCTEGLSSLQKRQVLDIFQEIGDKKTDLEKEHFFIYHIDNEVVIAKFDYLNTDNQGRTGGIRSKGVLMKKNDVINLDIESILSKINLTAIFDEIQNPIMPMLDFEFPNPTKFNHNTENNDLILANLLAQNRVAFPFAESVFFDSFDANFFFENRLNLTTHTNLSEKRHDFHVFASPFVRELTFIGDNEVKVKEEPKVIENSKEDKKTENKHRKQKNKPIVVSENLTIPIVETFESENDNEKQSFITKVMSFFKRF